MRLYTDYFKCFETNSPGTSERLPSEATHDQGPISYLSLFHFRIKKDTFPNQSVCRLTNFLPRANKHMDAGVSRDAEEKALIQF